MTTPSRSARFRSYRVPSMRGQHPPASALRYNASLLIAFVYVMRHQGDDATSSKGEMASGSDDRDGLGDPCRRGWLLDGGNGQRSVKAKRHSKCKRKPLGILSMQPERLHVCQSDASRLDDGLVGKEHDADCELRRVG